MSNTNPTIRRFWRYKKDKQQSTKHTHKTKARVTGTPLIAWGELRCSERVTTSAPLKAEVNRGAREGWTVNAF
jgi:hypothetical protein